MIPLLSIVMPVYNVEKFLRKSIKSVLQQEIKDFELIIVDDGSTDSSGTICDEYAKNDSRIIVIHKDNGGVVSARERALHLVRGKYITFLDSDDWIESRIYKDLIEYMELNDADVGIGGYILDYDGYTKKSFKINKSMLLDSNKALCEMFKRKMFSWELCDKIYRKEIIIDIHIDSEIFCGEDMTINYFALKKARLIAYKPIFAYHYLQRNGSTTKKSIKSINQLSAYAFNYIEHNESFKSDKLSKCFFYAKCSSIIGGVKHMTLSDCNKFSVEINIFQTYIKKYISKILFTNMLPLRIRLGAIVCLLPLKMRFWLLYSIEKYEINKTVS